MKILFIVNPAAGNGKASKEWSLISSLLDKKFKGLYDTEFTERPMHAVEIARSAGSRGYDTVVSCGGDGTLNEVVNGIVGSDLKLCLIPLGTGSDFGKSIGITDVTHSIEALGGGREIGVDVAKVAFQDSDTSRYFVNVLEIGFGAEVMKYVNSHSKGGRFSFLRGIISTVWKLKKFKPGVDIDSLRDSETIEVIVANGRYFGGGMLASPQSLVGDGILDLHLLRPVGKITTILRLRDLVKGTYIRKNFSFEEKVKSVSFSEKGHLVEMDGEVVGMTPISIQVMDKALRFLVPQLVSNSPRRGV